MLAYAPGYVAEEFDALRDSEVNGCTDACRVAFAVEEIVRPEMHEFRLWAARLANGLIGRAGSDSDPV